VGALVEAAPAGGYDGDASVRRLSEPRPAPPWRRGMLFGRVVATLLLLTVGIWVLGVVFIVTRFV
jgi:hypothetical protein